MPSTEPFDLLRIVEALSCWGSWEVSRENKQVPARPGPGLCLVIMHDDPQVLLNQLFTGTTFLCGSVGLEPAFLAPDGPVALGGEGRAGPWEVSLAWTDPIQSEAC